MDPLLESEKGSSCATFAGLGCTYAAMLVLSCAPPPTLYLLPGLISIARDKARLDGANGSSGLSRPLLSSWGRRAVSESVGRGSQPESVVSGRQQ